MENLGRGESGLEWSLRDRKQARSLRRSGEFLSEMMGEEEGGREERCCCCCCCLSFLIYAHTRNTR
jgi:transposase